MLEEIQQSRQFKAIYGLKSKIRIIKPELVTAVSPNGEEVTTPSQVDDSQGDRKVENVTDNTPVTDEDNEDDSGDVWAEQTNDQSPGGDDTENTDTGALAGNLNNPADETRQGDDSEDEVNQKEENDHIGEINDSENDTGRQSYGSKETEGEGIVNIGEASPADERETDSPADERKTASRASEREIASRASGRASLSRAGERMASSRASEREIVSRASDREAASHASEGEVTSPANEGEFVSHSIDREVASRASDREPASPTTHTP